MIARTFLFVLILSAATLWAQAAPPQTPPPSTQAPAAGTAKSQRRADMQQMRQQHMQQMQQQIERFRTLLDKLKADTANIQDPAGKQLAQDNIDLWQALYDHMQGMQQMMQQRPAGMGPGMMHRHDMGGNPPAPSKPATPPPPQ